MDYNYYILIVCESRCLPHCLQHAPGGMGPLHVSLVLKYCAPGHLIVSHSSVKLKKKLFVITDSLEMKKYNTRERGEGRIGKREIWEGNRWREEREREKKDGKVTDEN